MEKVSVDYNIDFSNFHNKMIKIVSCCNDSGPLVGEEEIGHAKKMVIVS